MPLPELSGHAVIREDHSTQSDGCASTQETLSVVLAGPHLCVNFAVQYAAGGRAVSGMKTWWGKACMPADALLTCPVLQYDYLMPQSHLPLCPYAVVLNTRRHKFAAS